MAAKVKYFLLHLAEAGSKQVKTALQTSSKNQVLGLREVAANLLQGNIPVDEKQRIKLKKFKTFFRELARKGVTRCRLVKHSKRISLLLQAAKQILSEL